MKPRIVVSGVNLIEGGPLSVLHDALTELSAHWSECYEIIALVHDRKLFNIPGITWLEFPQVKSSWLRRLRFEYWSCRALSRQLQPHLWLSMHDITPCVTARRQAVYCHNPAPFFRMSPREMRADWRFALFMLLYDRLYRIHIQRNCTVIVQQQWLRQEFQQRYGIHDVTVAHPSIKAAASPLIHHRESTHRFLYPVHPRSFKNIELLLRAAELLELRGCTSFELWLTCNGEENRYSDALRKRFSSLRCVHWLGLMSRDQVLRLYAEADYLIFPSRLETWGMPISEFKLTGKPLLLADLRYAHETCGSYDQVHFFAPDDAGALAEVIEAIAQHRFTFGRSMPAAIEQPFASNWCELFELLLVDS